MRSKRMVGVQIGKAHLDPRYFSNSGLFKSTRAWSRLQTTAVLVVAERLQSTEFSLLRVRSEGEVDQQAQNELIGVAAIVNDRTICGITEETIISGQRSKSPPFTEGIGV